MKITPPPSTERVPDELLPKEAEAQWIGKFKVRSEDLLLRNIARSCLQGFRPTDDEAQCALNVLLRPYIERDPHAEALAVWILGFIKPNHVIAQEAYPCLTEWVSSSESRSIRTLRYCVRTATTTGLYGMCFGALCSCIYIACWGGVPPSYSLTILWFLTGLFCGVVLGGLAGFCFAPLFVPVASLFFRRQERRTQKAALYTLSRWNDPRCIGAVAYASTKADPPTLAHIQETLGRLLEKLTPDYYGVMPVGTTDQLCRALEVAEAWDWRSQTPTKPFNSYEPLAIPLLKALEIVGSGNAAKTVRTFIEKNYHAEIVALAEQILPILTTREQEESARTTLLRHSETPTTSADEMLRPVINSSPSDEAETLIRPVL